MTTFSEVSCEHCGLPTDSPRVCFECGCGMCEDCTIEHDNAGHKHWCQNVEREKPVTVIEAAALADADRAVLQIAFITGVPCWSPSMSAKGWLDTSGRLSPKGRELAVESLRADIEVPHEPVGDGEST